MVVELAVKVAPDWTTQTGRKETYPYDEWFNGTTWRLRRGTHFVQPRRQMAHRIRHAAKKRGLEVSVRHYSLRVTIFDRYTRIGAEEVDFIEVRRHLNRAPTAFG